MAKKSYILLWFQELKSLFEQSFTFSVLYFFPHAKPVKIKQTLAIIFLTYIYFLYIVAHIIILKQFIFTWK